MNHTQTTNRGYWGYQEVDPADLKKVVGAGDGGCGGCGGDGGDSDSDASISSAPPTQQSETGSCPNPNSPEQGGVSPQDGAALGAAVGSVVGLTLSHSTSANTISTVTAVTTATGTAIGFSAAVIGSALVGGYNAIDAKGKDVGPQPTIGNAGGNFNSTTFNGQQYSW